MDENVGDIKNVIFGQAKEIVDGFLGYGFITDGRNTYLRGQVSAIVDCYGIVNVVEGGDTAENTF